MNEQISASESVIKPVDAGTEKKTGRYAVPLDRLPTSVYDGRTYTEGRNKLTLDGLRAIRENSNSAFSESGLAHVIRTLANSTNTEIRAAAASLAGALEGEVQHYSDLRRFIANGGEKTFTADKGDGLKRYVLKNEQFLTLRLYAEHFSNMPPLWHDIQGYTEGQLAELRLAIGIADAFQKKPIRVARLEDVPYNPQQIELDTVYEVFEKNSQDNSHELMRLNRESRSRFPVIRHVVFFKHPENPDQILRYSDDGVAGDMSGYSFDPARFHLRTVTPTTTESTISYLEHRLR